MFEFVLLGLILTIDVCLQMRFTEKVSVWPVALVEKFPYESPVVISGRVVTYFSGYLQDVRKFPLDMAAFAVNTRFYLKSNATFDPYKQAGYTESNFLSALGVTKEELEPKADNCTKVINLYTLLN